MLKTVVLLNILVETMIHFFQHSLKNKIQKNSLNMK